MHRNQQQQQQQDNHYNNINEEKDVENKNAYNAHSEFLHNSRPLEGKSAIDRYEMAVIDTVLWAQKNKYQAAPEDKEANYKHSSEYLSTTVNSMYLTGLVGWFLTVRFRYGPGEYHSPISASIARLVQRIRFVQPPNSRFYKIAVWGSLLLSWSRQTRRTKVESFMKYHAPLQTPFGVELRKRIAQVEPNSMYLNEALREYDEKQSEYVAQTQVLNGRETDIKAQNRASVTDLWGNEQDEQDNADMREEREFSERRREKLRRRKLGGTGRTGLTDEEER